MATANATVMFTDIRDFTPRTSRETRTGLEELLRTHEALLLPVIGHYGGRVVKTIGDAFLVCFESPTNAVLCGVLIQRRLREYNATAPPEKQIHRVVPGVSPGRLHPGAAELACVYSGRTRQIPCVGFVPVTSREPEDTLWRDLSADPGAFRSLQRVGDCKAPGLIVTAVYDGHRAARDLGRPGIVKRDRPLVDAAE